MKKHTHLFIKIKKLKKYSFHANKKSNSKFKRNKYKFFPIMIKIIFICIILLIFQFTKMYLLFPEIFNYEQYIKEKQIIESLKVCICTIGKLENLYIREFVQHYKKYGVDKIFLYDNNNIDGEKFEEVINDYIKKGFVDVLNWRGKVNPQMEFLNDCYQKNNNNYDWLILFDIDEFIYLYNYTNVKLFLNEDKFKNCQEIFLNLVSHTDNNHLYYENKPLYKRFPKTVPKTRREGQLLSMKTIIRGHIKGVKILSMHRGDYRLRTCNNSGKYEKLVGHSTYNSDQKYYYIDHYTSKSTEEFIQKIKRGDAYNNSTYHILQKANSYFSINEITQEKVELLEKGFGFKIKKAFKR